MLSRTLQPAILLEMFFDSIINSKVIFKITIGTLELFTNILKLQGL